MQRPDLTWAATTQLQAQQATVLHYWSYMMPHESILQPLHSAHTYTPAPPCTAATQAHIFAPATRAHSDKHVRHVHIQPEACEHGHTSTHDTCSIAAFSSAAVPY